MATGVSGTTWVEGDTDEIRQRIFYTEGVAQFAERWRNK